MAINRAAVAAAALTGADLFNRAKEINREIRAAKSIYTTVTSPFKYLSPPVRPLRRFNHAMPARARSKSKGTRFSKTVSRKRKYKTRTRPVRRNVSRRAPSRVYKKTRSQYASVNKLLGPPPGYGLGNKRAVYESASWANHNDKVLYGQPLIKVAFNADHQKMTYRSMGACLIKGISLDWLFRLKTQYTGDPVKVRWAILCNREDQTGGTTATDVSTADFFKKDAPTDILEVASTFSVTETVQKMDDRQINSRKWLVLRQGRFLLQRNSSSANDLALGGLNQMDRFKRVKEYIPLNTQMRWADNAATITPVDHNIWFVHWGYDVAKVATEVTPVAAYDTMHSHTTWFKDSKS